MGSATHISFRTVALASGLVKPEQIAAASARLRREVGATAVSDEALLASTLVELGAINAWQAEQLRSGRSKFQLGPYRMIDSIGQGGMGQVFKAEHVLMGREVAVKVLPKNRTTPLAIESFTREIRAQAQLDHPNLVRAFDAGHDGNVHYLVTEYVPGGDLRRLVKRRQRLTAGEAAWLVSQAADGLGHAHEMGLIHRDVKPGNVLVTPDGRAKLSDLGLAGYVHELDEELSSGATDPRYGKIVGTADYLPPEQILDPREVSPVGDIYSLGCTLYYAVTGKVPFPGGGTKDKLRRHCEDTPINPRHFNESLDDEFLLVLCDMMEKEPSLRIQSADEVRERLAPWAVNADDWSDLATLPLRRGGPSSSGSGREMADTAPAETGYGEVELNRTHSSSNLSGISQTTDSIVAALEETIHSTSVAPVFHSRRRIPAWLTWSAVAATAAAAALTAIALARGILLN